jgi:hypothetical protein
LWVVIISMRSFPNLPFEYLSFQVLGGCPRIVFVARSSENFVAKAERAKSPKA